MDNKHIFDIFQTQKQHLKDSSFKDVRARIEALKLLKKNLKEMQDEFYEALRKDLNKSQFESYMVEIGMTLSEISYMIKHCNKFSKTRRVSTPLAHFHSSSKVVASPYGCVLIISPWNYPVMLSIEPIVDAIAAGNSVVLKPSELSPNVSLALEKLIEKTFDKKQVAVIQGGKEECTYLLEQDFDYIFYTGSTRVGKIVMQKAAEHFTPVTLELGGKSPCIVDKTADIKLAAKRIVFGKFLNCGQTCVAPDYILCEESIKTQLVEEISRQIILQYTTDPIRNEEYPKMINKKQFDAMLGLIEKDKILFGGKFDEGKLKIEPTLVSANFKDRCMQEEIFGPILPIVTFSSLEDVVDTINSLPSPLALYIFSNSKQNQKFVIKNTNFGGGCINDTIVHLANPRLAFGGFRQSGIGSYHGKAGFDTFTHYKSILKKYNYIDLPIRYQPANKIKNFLLKIFLR